MSDGRIFKLSYKHPDSASIHKNGAEQTLHFPFMLKLAVRVVFIFAEANSTQQCSVSYTFSSMIGSDQLRSFFLFSTSSMFARNSLEVNKYILLTERTKECHRIAIVNFDSIVRWKKSWIICISVISSCWTAALVLKRDCFFVVIDKVVISLDLLVLSVWSRYINSKLDC